VNNIDPALKDDDTVGVRTEVSIAVHNDTIVLTNFEQTWGAPPPVLRFGAQRMEARLGRKISPSIHPQAPLGRRPAPAIKLWISTQRPATWLARSSPLPR
jgi:hypothetical protein